MTLAEVKEYQKAMLADPNNKFNSSAVGKYQIVGTTLKELQSQLELKDTDKFDAATQEKMAEVLLKRRGLDKYMQGTMTAKEFQLALAKEWASIADPRTGKGYYDGQRTAHTTSEVAQAAIARLTNTSTTATPTDQPSPQLPSATEVAKQEASKRQQEKERKTRKKVCF